MTEPTYGRARACARCEQEGTCPLHLFERRARDAGTRDNRPPDVDSEYVTIDRARQLRIIADADKARDAMPVPAVAPAEREPTQEELTWSVRGEPRTRAHFADPHPQDFPGGLPLPPECPTLATGGGPQPAPATPPRP